VADAIVSSEPARERDIPFTVDADLLRELGERLVGRPHIALAELVKNSYDADATKAVITLGDSHIEVTDDGNGMNELDFERFWMRVGSAHKEKLGVSRRFGRPLTGSKGVGRLSTQFLAKQVEIRTVAIDDEKQELVATVNWPAAVASEELTRATAHCLIAPRRSEFAGKSLHGTRVTLRSLNHAWDDEAVRRLAQEIWSLQAPFRANPRLTTTEQRAFSIELKARNPEVLETFRKQMSAVLDVWHAKIVGRLSVPVGIKARGHELDRRLEVSLQFAEGRPQQWTWLLPDCRIDQAEFEIRIFHLKHRQPFGLKVGEIRTYLNANGGVHVYDSGFHLPYYGPENDWLGIELDHSHRKFTSGLLPAELQVGRGLNYLPTNSRIFGIVHVDTAREREYWVNQHPQANVEPLMIQISRDRLVDNFAFRDLARAVRTAIDYYTMQEAKRAAEVEEQERPAQPLRSTDLLEYVDSVTKKLPADVAVELRNRIAQANDSIEVERRRLASQANVLAALATAGIAAVAFEHEIAKQYKWLEEISTDLSQSAGGEPRLTKIASELQEWIEGARATRAVFQPLTDEGSRTEVKRYNAAALISGVVQRSRALLRGIDVDTDSIGRSIRLPHGTLAEWSAVFQNLLVNSANAVGSAEKRAIEVTSRVQGRRVAILVADTGPGVELATAHELFAPFVRRLPLSEEVRASGAGGMGLGLSIVRTICQNRDADVAFVKPVLGFNTTVEVAWSESDA